MRARAIQQYSVCQNLNANVQVLQNIQFKQCVDDIRLQLTAMQVNYNALLHQQKTCFGLCQRSIKRRKKKKENKDECKRIHVFIAAATNFGNFVSYPEGFGSGGPTVRVPLNRGCFRGADEKCSDFRGWEIPRY